LLKLDRMESELLKGFLSAQVNLMKAKGHAIEASKTIIRPEDKKKAQAQPEDDYEEYYNYILEKKPPKKKVIKFLQVCIDTMIAEDD